MILSHLDFTISVLLVRALFRAFVPRSERKTAGGRWAAAAGGPSSPYFDDVEAERSGKKLGTKAPEISYHTACWNEASVEILFLEWFDIF